MKVNGTLAQGTVPSPPSSIKNRQDVDPVERKAAEGMEAMFLDHLLKVMRETVPKNDMDLDGPATGIYRAMYDSEIAQRAAHTGGVGIADLLIDYWERNRYNQKQEASLKEQEAAKPHTGGANEGNPI